MLHSVHINLEVVIYVSIMLLGIRFFSSCFSDRNKMRKVSTKYGKSTNTQAVKKIFTFYLSICCELCSISIRIQFLFSFFTFIHSKEQTVCYTVLEHEGGKKKQMLKRFRKSHLDYSCLVIYLIQMFIYTNTYAWLNTKQ